MLPLYPAPEVVALSRGHVVTVVVTAVGGGVLGGGGAVAGHLQVNKG